MTEGTSALLQLLSNLDLSSSWFPSIQSSKYATRIPSPSVVDQALYTFRFADVLPTRYHWLEYSGSLGRTKSFKGAGVGVGRVGVGEGKGEGDGDGVGEGEGEGVGDGDGEGVGVGDGDGEGVGGGDRDGEGEGGEGEGEGEREGEKEGAGDGAELNWQRILSQFEHDSGDSNGS